MRGGDDGPVTHICSFAEGNHGPGRYEVDEYDGGQADVDQYTLIVLGAAGEQHEGKGATLGVPDE